MTASDFPSLDVYDTERRLRDLVALSTLPAVWMQAEPLRIAESLAAALLATAEVDSVYVSLIPEAAGPSSGVMQTVQGGSASDADVQAACAEWLQAHDPEELLVIPGADGTRVAWSVRPLGFRGEYGLLAGGLAGDRVPTPFQYLLFNVAATQATVAMHQVRLLRSLQRALAEKQATEAREHEARDIAETLNEVTRAITAELDLQKLTQRITDAATKLTHAEFGAFFYNAVNPEGESYVLYVISGVPRERFENFPLPRNTAIFDPTFRGTGVVRLHDVRADPRYGHNPPYQGMPKGHLPVCSYLAVPVVSRSGEVLGGLFFGHSQPGVFTEQAERIAVGIAAQAAIAMDNAHLFEKAQREIAERKEAERRIQSLNETLKERIVDRDRLLHELERSQKELQAKVADLEVFHDIAVSRELKMIELEKEVARLTSLEGADR